MARRDHRPLLADLRIAALVVCGCEDRVTPPAASEELHRLLPHAPLEWIEQAGHQTPLEQPAVVARHLLALIDRANRSPQP
jgi:hypothetical protein